MPTLFLMCGYSFAGKSTLANFLAAHIPNCTIISLDGINAQRGLDSNIPIPISEWEKTHHIALQHLHTALSAGKTVIIDDTNPLLKLRERFRSVANQLNIKTIVIYLPTSQQEINRRIKAAQVSQDRKVEPSEVRQYVLSIFEVPNSAVETVLVNEQHDTPQAFLQKHAHLFTT